MQISTINVQKQIQDSIKDMPNYNYMLGRNLIQPFRPANSGSRALMSSIHSEQSMTPMHPEVPIIQTGYETEYGEQSTSFVTAKSNYTVIYKINKLENNDSHYFLIIKDEEKDEYDVIERLTYKHNTESYGYLWNNKILDSLKPGDKIHEGDIIKTSIGYDDYYNKMNGVNLTTLYLACDQNMEDSIILSDKAAQKLATPLINSNSITINDNDILTNVYGNETLYKTFPDVGEEIQNGIFCSIRRLENENILYSLSQARLREPMINDRNILMNGIVADIDVFCNNPSALGDSHYNQQLFYYYNQSNIFYKKVVDLIGPLAMGSKLSYNLKKLYGTCRDILNGKQFFKERQFSNVILSIKVIESLPVQTGDKLADRYGGKGIVSKIVPENMMPVLDNGTHVEIIKNQSTCINRENIGQLHEQSLTFIGMRMIDFFRTRTISYSAMCQMLFKFISMVDTNQAIKEMSCIDLYDEKQCEEFMQSIFDDDCIILSIEPFTTTVNINTIREIYKEFPWIKPYTVYMPIEDSNGNIRFTEARRQLIVGKIYNYRLKQYAEEKFSVTSLSATNLKGLNTRSRANKIYETKYTKTPIMFGFMETGDLAHLGIQYVVMNLMLYASSPSARRLFEQLLIGDPYDIDIKLDEDSKNRNAEIINALLKTMGLSLVFKKIPKVKKILAHNVMCKDVKLKGYEYKTNIRDIIGHDDEFNLHYGIAMRDKHGKRLCGNVMVKEVNNNERNNTEITDVSTESENG